MSSTTAPPRRRVAVTAFGVVSPLGLGAPANLEGLIEGRDAIRPVAQFDVSKTRCKTAGAAPPFPEADAVPARRRLHRASQMLTAASREAQTMDPAFIPEWMVIGTTSGGMSCGESFYRSQTTRIPLRERAFLLANYMPQKAVLDAQAACGFSAPSQIIANACASGTNAIGHAFMLIRAGLHRRVACGGYDALSEMVFAGFDSLQASTAEKVRPFDKNRSGLALGEGAAVFFLEEWDSALARGASILAEITGYGISTDNHHLTQPHPSGIGPRMAMERALASAVRDAAEIDYINAHGTATAFNDGTEGLAISQLFGARTPVSSTKSMTGHALGGAGSIEAAFSILAIQNQFLPPNINYLEADPAWNLDIVANRARPARVRRILSNSFGFGGTNASIVIEEVPGKGAAA